MNTFDMLRAENTRVTKWSAAFCSEDDYLPCPFCGTTDTKIDIYAYRGMCIIACNTCGCNGPLRDNSDDARVAWNDRVSKRNPTG